MNRIMRKALLVSACVLTVPALMAQAANKTYFASRNELQQNGRAWTLGAPHKMNQTARGRFGLAVDASVFYSESDNKTGMGKHFGAASKANLSDAAGTVVVLLDETKASNALHGRDIDHTYDNDTAEPMRGEIKLAPWQKRLGAHLHADWDVSKAFAGLKGWHASVDAPVVEVTNNLGMTVVSSTASTTDADDKKTESGTVAEFFAGTYSQSASAENTQAALSHGRVNVVDRKKSGFADLKLGLSYDFATERDSAVRVHGSLILPTGNKSTGVDMFEALYGNNGHVGAALGGSGSIRLWNNAARGMSLWVSGSAEYTFLFQGREKRVAGLYDNTAGTKKLWGWGHYAVGVEVDKSGTFPMANKLAQDMYVTPGSHFDGVVGLTWGWKNFHFNVGYNAFYRQAEDVKLASDWAADRFGLAARTYVANTAAADFDGTDSAGPVQPRGVESTKMAGATAKYQVDTDACTGADQETHALMLGAGYSGKVRNICFNVSVGGNYEFAADATKALDGYGFGGKIGFSF